MLQNTPKLGNELDKIFFTNNKVQSIGIISIRNQNYYFCRQWKSFYVPNLGIKDAHSLFNFFYKVFGEYQWMIQTIKAAKLPRCNFKLVCQPRLAWHGHSGRLFGFLKIFGPDRTSVYCSHLDFQFKHPHISTQPTTSNRQVATPSNVLDSTQSTRNVLLQQCLQEGNNTAVAGSNHWEDRSWVFTQRVRLSRLQCNAFNKHIVHEHGHC